MEWRTWAQTSSASDTSEVDLKQNQLLTIHSCARNSIAAKGYGDAITRRLRTVRGTLVVNSNPHSVGAIPFQLAFGVSTHTETSKSPTQCSQISNSVFGFLAAHRKANNTRQKNAKVLILSGSFNSHASFQDVNSWRVNSEHVQNEENVNFWQQPTCIYALVNVWMQSIEI